MEQCLKIVRLADRNCLEVLFGAYFFFLSQTDEFPVLLDKNQDLSDWQDLTPKDTASVPSGDVQNRNIFWVAS